MRLLALITLVTFLLAFAGTCANNNGFARCFAGVYMVASIALAAVVLL